MKKDCVNGIADGIKGIRRGFVDKKELYDASYKEGSELAFRAAGIDYDTGYHLRLVGGFCLTKDQEEAALWLAGQYINQGGEISEAYA